MLDLGRCHEQSHPEKGHFSTSQLQHWRGITDNNWLLDTLEKGYCLQFHHRPPVSTRVCPTVVQGPHQALALSEKIQNLLRKDAIEPVDPHWVSLKVFSCPEEISFVHFCTISFYDSDIKPHSY